MVDNNYFDNPAGRYFVQIEYSTVTNLTGKFFKNLPEGQSLILNILLRQNKLQEDSYS